PPAPPAARSITGSRSLSRPAGDRLRAVDTEVDRYNRRMTGHALYALPVIALLIAGCAAEAPRQVAEPPAEASLENGSFTAELGGHPIHYEVHGSGPALMTVPNSWGLTLGGLRALYRPLEEHLTMVYFDPRGMGGSGPMIEDSDMSLAAVRDDFDALRQHLGLQRVNAIGWSNGATNLIFLASERPEILESAIFLHGVSRVAPEDFATFDEDYPEWNAASESLQKDLAREDVDDDYRTQRFRRYSLEEAYPNLFADVEQGRELLPQAWADVEFSYRHGAYSQQELPTWDLTEQLSAIPTRSLVLAGAHDLLPAERAQEMSDALADAEFGVFENSGHFAPLEEPQVFVAAVRKFLEGG
ncbi:MAG: alpha/beta fold hydrolase, partial [Thermoanaerobaculia bacterium]